MNPQGEMVKATLRQPQGLPGKSILVRESRVTRACEWLERGSGKMKVPLSYTIALDCRIPALYRETTTEHCTEKYGLPLAAGRGRGARTSGSESSQHETTLPPPPSPSP